MTARDPFGKSRFCRGCGCTENNACTMFTPDGPVGCAWVLLDLDEATGVCDACAAQMGWHQDGLRLVGMDPWGGRDGPVLTIAEFAADPTGHADTPLTFADVARDRHPQTLVLP